jgi:hypothetical protein
VIAQWYSAGLRAGWSGFRVPAGAGNFSLHHRVQTGSGAHPASYPMSTRGCYPEVKWREREADHSPPPSSEVKKAWGYTSTPPIRIWSVNAQDSNNRDGKGKVLIHEVQHARVYLKVSGLAAWSDNCKCYSSLPLGAVVSLFCESG